VNKPTKKEIALANKWYEKGRASGLDEGRVQGRREPVDAREADFKRKKAEALVDLAKAMSQALNAIAGILDNAHGVLS
jgi:hypothetical protein